MTLLRDLRERVAALKHDLGKYVAWMSANLDEELWDGPVQTLLVEALQRDILATMTRNGRDEPAWVVWARLTSDLPRPFPAPELDAVARAVERLESAGAPLRRGDRQALASLRHDIRAAQGEIRTNLARLHQRLQES